MCDKVLTDNTTHDLVLSIINNKSVYGVVNVFDSDSDVLDASVENNIPLENNWAYYKPTDLQIPISKKLKRDKNQIETITRAISPIGNILDPPVSNSSTIHSSPNLDNTESESNAMQWAFRRRPSVPRARVSTDPKHELGHLYKEIGEAKLKLINQELEDISKKRKRDEEQFKLKMELLMLELKNREIDSEIKKATLRNIQKGS